MKKKTKNEYRLEERDWFAGLAEGSRWNHPELFTEAVAGFERHFVVSMHLAYTSYVLRGLLTHDVTYGGNRDARLCALITALQFVSPSDLKSKKFAELYHAWMDYVQYPPDYSKHRRKQTHASLKRQRNKKDVREIREIRKLGNELADQVERAFRRKRSRPA